MFTPRTLPKHMNRLPVLLALAALGFGCLAGGSVMGQSSSPGSASEPGMSNPSGPQANQDSAINSTAGSPGDDDRLPFMAKPDSPSEAAEPGGLGLIVRTLGALLLVMGILVGGVWGLKHLKKSPLARKSGAPELAVLNSVSIGDRRTLVVVRFGANTLLLGSTPQSVTLLASEEIEEDISLPARAPRARSVVEDTDNRTNTTQAYSTRSFGAAPSFSEQLQDAQSWAKQDEEFGEQYSDAEAEDTRWYQIKPPTES